MNGFRVNLKCIKTVLFKLDIYGREHLFKENDVVEAKITDGGVSFLIGNCWTFNYRIADICENFEII